MSHGVYELMRGPKMGDIAQRWAVAREMRARIKARFDHEGIEIPYPQRMVWHRDAPANASGTTAEPGVTEDSRA